ncbi:hypothetical protein SDC9_21773 [bioreactor metagenome]|jgi:uncharacterized protein (DUF2062 family)|uniref:DUF2062 domain-containing protein n=1 Tax=bioreactor metagenome TaxID=1076179 RepID=A0A644UAN1_9ZZZZ|nr:DUF2062 domain-containing protein [Lentimicrobium sp.]MEA5109045.1 DUF2062 domain-containing protein [Lentimicrobium sp.]HCT70152.1 hypothetical protein [Bacteroidales bacterium]
MKPVIKILLSERYLKPVKAFLSQGLSPLIMARTIAAGCCIGIIPVPGTSTLLCTAVALLFKMNLALIQVINYAVFPLQILLAIPFYKAAAWMINSEMLQDFPETLIAAFNADWWGAINNSFQVIFTAFLIWLLLSVPLFWLVGKIVSAMLLKLKADTDNTRDL